MKEVILSILQAEEMADQIVSNATEKAKKIMAEQEAESERAKSKAIADFSVSRAEALARAEKKAMEIYQAEMKKGEEESAELFRAADNKLDALAERIVREIVE